MIRDQQAQNKFHKHSAAITVDDDLQAIADIVSVVAPMLLITQLQLCHLLHLRQRRLRLMRFQDQGGGANRQQVNKNAVIRKTMRDARLWKTTHHHI